MEFHTISLAPEALGPRDAYRLLISVLVPRPIAWVSSQGTDGWRNLAPFSFFGGVGNYPPTIMIAVGQRQERPKDTLRNIQETGEFVVHIVDETLAPAMNLTSGEYAYEVNEFELAQLATLPALEVRPPRLAAAPVAMECKATQIIPVQGTTYTMILGRVLQFHLREGLLRANGLVDADLLRPVARLGGDEYATLGTVFEMQRPPA